MDKDHLAAFADGELSPEEAAKVVMHLADNPQDQAYVDELYAANEALARAFSAPLQEPVPEAIREAIMGKAATNVVFFRPKPKLALALGGLAASVAVAAVLLTGLSGGPQSTGIALGPLAAIDPVAGVLNTGVSGALVQLPDGRTSMVLATFGMPDGRYCREFEVVDIAGGRVDYAVGCRAGETWTIEATIAEAAVEDLGQGFVTASGDEANLLTQFLERGGAPVMLDAAAEADVISKGWSDR
ncbi:zf-HC2 domain-containing protein [Pseudotabrizicola algicola]|uniref:Putative zinc-finger domain-containing protein n=1 Tax=Pseudotabrizicola algicola TaxID=2709381 RepID=A0A6B3RU44_9RHOB|nr:zf-HC2 domain-containing protein [Pseudotabrizicola algicola]NEX46552.1 hypothetical protein [Pseudotabrizicola algicola]